MQTLPDFWLVYISIDNENEFPEMSAIAPSAMNRREMSYEVRRVLTAVDVFHAVHPDARVVFLADVTAWLHADRGLEWYDLHTDVEEAIATLHEGGPSVVLDADPMALAVVARGRADMHLLAAAQPDCSAKDFETEVREKIATMLKANWHSVASTGSGSQTSRAIQPTG